MIENIENQLQLIQLALNSCSNGVIITGLADTDYAIIYVNDAFSRITGYSSEDVLGKNCRFLQKVDKNQPTIENLRIAVNKHDEGYAVLRNYRKNGELFWNEIYIAPIKNAQGKTTHFIGIQNDVTIRYEMKMLLIKNEAKMKAIFDNVSDGIIITNETGEIGSFNFASQIMFGYNAEELNQKNISELVFKNERRRINFNFQGKREIQAIKKNGDIFLITLQIKEIQFEEQHLFIFTIYDLTKQRQIEDRYQTLFKYAPEAILIYRDKCIVEVNQSCLQLWKANYPKQLVGHSPYELFHPDFHEIIRERIKNVTERNIPNPTIEQKIVRLDGSVVDVLVSAVPFEDGKSVHVIVTDITERKENERALIESEDKYRNLSNHLESVREEERTRIAREIHDELGSILTALKMDLSWLHQKLPSNLFHYLKKIKGMIDYVDKAVSSTRDIITELRPSILDHLGLFAAIEWQVEKFREQTDVLCVLKISSDDCFLDKKLSTAIFRVVQEALTNIMRHANASEAKIDIEVIDSFITLIITDNGVGMNNVKKSERYGIQGMYERVRCCGGEITIDSEKEKGTTITLRIPHIETN